MNGGEIKLREKLKFISLQN